MSKKEIKEELEEIAVKYGVPIGDLESLIIRHEEAVIEDIKKEKGVCPKCGRKMIEAISCYICESCWHKIPKTFL